MAEEEKKEKAKRGKLQQSTQQSYTRNQNLVNWKTLKPKTRYSVSVRWPHNLLIPLAYVDELS